MMNDKEARYNHDYVHCTGEGCEHYDCVKRLAYEEMVALGITPKMPVIDRCTDEDISYVKVSVDR